MGEKNAVTKIDVNVMSGVEKDFVIESPCAKVYRNGQRVYVSGKIKIGNRIWPDKINCVICFENDIGEILLVEKADVYANTKCGFFCADIYIDSELNCIDSVSEVKQANVLFFTT